MDSFFVFGKLAKCISAKMQKFFPFSLLCGILDMIFILLIHAEMRMTPWHLPTFMFIPNTVC